MALQLQQVARLLVLALLGGMISVALSSANEPGAQEEPEVAAPSLQAPTPGVTGDEIFSELLEHNHGRDVRLQRYTALRTYEVTNDKGKVHAKAVVIVQYQAPSTKSFTTLSVEGSRIVRRLVFNGLMDSEVETAAGRSHRDSSIRPENYTFQILGEEDVGGYHCFVAEAVPKRRDKYLFEGRIWINTQDFGIVQIAGYPAKNPSFWIRRVKFVRRYQKLGDFWLPLKDETFVDLRIYGRKTLTIDHQDYAVNGAQRANEQTKRYAGSPRAALPSPTSEYSGQGARSRQFLPEPGIHTAKEEEKDDGAHREE